MVTSDIGCLMWFLGGNGGGAVFCSGRMVGSDGTVGLSATWESILK